MEQGRFNWPVLMRAGMRELGLCPSAFWQLTPAELQLMLGRFRSDAPLTRIRLGALLDAYPDKTGETIDDGH
ncbi:MAG: rcc01693 family protein [Paracoccaceae bacterium]